MLRTVNRVLIGLTGLALLTLGGAVLAVGLGANPPSWWLHDGPHDVLLSTAERTRWREESWWWPVVLGGLALLVLLALWWLTANLRRRRLGEVLINTGDGESALLRGSALENVLATQTAHLDGVSHARVHLTGRRDAPQTQVHLRVEPHASPGEALRHFITESLARARDSAALKALPAEVRVRAMKHKAERVS
ncbi:alkaline shock response membrane anchor protein AmaP [Streptomyces roseirectus]|uniref:Alkaline shock response membrane anchor protein AmaP n=1 Tax=Streptomyces roseirectus TaxID=2768066 RepID=A0A7H0IL24_9ACTN|nr:alkaline shock response membrane anchor protein AmaP [Streptomyces roseirectus]QNP73490.1 alkaline shock response membrane anchor protein AmaP [Streptomyces roseirectus]